MAPGNDSNERDETMSDEPKLRTYPLTYEVTPRPERVTADWVREHGLSACDAVVILSMLYPDDGSFSLLPISLDGRTGEPVTDNELWKVWTLIAHNLAQSADLSEGKRALCATVFDMVREVVLAGRTSALEEGAKTPT